MIKLILPAPLMLMFEVSTDLKPVELAVAAEGVETLYDLFARLAETYPRFAVYLDPVEYDQLHKLMMFINGQIVRIRDPKRFREVAVADGDEIRILLPYEGG